MVQWSSFMFAGFGIFSCLCHSYIVFIIDQDAESLFNDFNGGEISGESIEASFVSL